EMAIDIRADAGAGVLHAKCFSALTTTPDNQWDGARPEPVRSGGPAGSSSTHAPMASRTLRTARQGVRFPPGAPASSNSILYCSLSRFLIPLLSIAHRLLTRPRFSRRSASSLSKDATTG